jgi:hypothetical protein
MTNFSQFKTALQSTADCDASGIAATFLLIWLAKWQIKIPF